LKRWTRSVRQLARVRKVIDRETDASLPFFTQWGANGQT
jgi:hypothetical protein